MYIFFASLSILFYLLEKLILSTEKGHWAKDNMEQVEGVYVIFLPFFPAVFWSAGMWGIQAKQGSKSEDSLEKKND